MFEFLLGLVIGGAFCGCRESETDRYLREQKEEQTRRNEERRMQSAVERALSMVGPWEEGFSVDLDDVVVRLPEAARSGLTSSEQKELEWRFEDEVHQRFKRGECPAWANGTRGLVTLPSSSRQKIRRDLLALLPQHLRHQFERDAQKEHGAL